MTLFVASLYLLIIAFLFGSAIYILSRDPFARLNRAYTVLALAQLGWVGSLFVFNATLKQPDLLWIGRANFAAAALVAPAVFVFVQALLGRRFRYAWWIAGETLIVALLSLLTGFVDQSETLKSGTHLTTYGALFPVYVVHLLVYLGPAVYQALRPPLRLTDQQRAQVRLLGYGFLVTILIGLTTNVLIPYVSGDFLFIDVGTLATVVALAAISYAACVHHLFNIRVVVRTALVFTLLIAFALELYKLAVDTITALLPIGDPTERHVAAAAVAFIINAFTQEPLKWWLERLTVRILKSKKR